MQFNMTLNHGRTRLELLCVFVIQLTQGRVHRIRGCHHCDRSLLQADPLRKCIHKRDICDILIANIFVICGVRLVSSHRH